MTDNRTGGGRYYQDPITGELTKEMAVQDAPAQEAPAETEIPADGETAEATKKGNK